MSRDRLGDFEQQVLVTVLRLGGEAYSVPIVLDLEERTGREIAQAAVFIVLRRLEEKGLLSSRMDESSVAVTGRVRRYFKTTPEGIRLLKESHRVALRLWAGIDAILDEV